jgi:hypothetical protein
VYIKNGENLMATATTRWNLVVPKELDKSLRQYLANEGRGKKGELSRFVTEAVNRQVLQAAMRSARERNNDLNTDEVEALVEESLEWARAQMRQV